MLGANSTRGLAHSLCAGGLGLDRILAERKVLLLLALLLGLEALLLLSEALADGARLLEAQVERHQILILVKDTQLRLLRLVDHRQHTRNRLPHNLAARRESGGARASAASVPRALPCIGRIQAGARARRDCG